METTPGTTTATVDAPPLWASPVEARDTGRAVFGQVMFMVAAALGFAAGGAYVGRGLPFGVALVLLLAAIALTFVVSRARRAQNDRLGMGLLYAIALLMGMALGPSLAAYAAVEGGAQVITQAAGLTALFIGGLGTVGYATRRDLSGVARVCFWALLALIGFGIAAVFVAIPGANLVYSVAGLVIFAGFTMYDFQQLRRSQGDDAVIIALSIFLDAVNVFLFILDLLGGEE